MYIEEVVILNFVIDYIILFILNYILKNNISNKRIILSSIFGELSLLLLFININYYVVILFKAIFGIIIIYIYGGYKNKKYFLSNIIWFYSLSFFLGGFLYYVKLNVFNYRWFLIFIPIVMNIYKYFICDLIKFNSLKYRVNIYLNDGNVLYLNGFMDTGNTLIEPYTNKKVIIINNKNICENYFLVPLNTINGSSLMKCFKPKRVFIDKIGDRDDVVIGISNKKFSGYDCLLNYNLMEG